MRQHQYCVDHLNRALISHMSANPLHPNLVKQLTKFCPIFSCNTSSSCCSSTAHSKLEINKRFFLIVIFQGLTHNALPKPYSPEDHVIKHQSEKAHYDVLETQYERELLTLLYKDIEENRQNLVILTPELKQELEEIIGDYKIDLGGEFQKTYFSRPVNLVAKHTSIRF